jgi:hypothetical protein
VKDVTDIKSMRQYGQHALKRAKVLEGILQKSGFGRHSGLSLLRSSDAEMFFSMYQGGITPACGPIPARCVIARAHGRTCSKVDKGIGATPPLL